MAIQSFQGKSRIDALMHQADRVYSRMLLHLIHSQIRYAMLESRKAGKPLRPRAQKHALINYRNRLSQNQTVHGRSQDLSQGTVKGTFTFSKMSEGMCDSLASCGH